MNGYVDFGLGLRVVFVLEFGQDCDVFLHLLTLLLPLLHVVHAFLGLDPLH